MIFKLLRLYWRETCNLRTLAFLAVMLLLTALLLGNMPVSGEGGVKIFSPVRLSVIDEDESFISYTLIDQFSDLTIVDKLYVEDIETARQRLANNEILLIMVIPPDFYEQTMLGQVRAPLTVYLNDKMPTEAMVFVRLLENTTGSVEALEAALFTYQDLSRPLFADENEFWSYSDAAIVDLAFHLVGRNSILAVDETRKLNSVYYVISSLATLLAMLTSLLVLMQVQQERRSGMHERLLVANVPWWQLFVAKQLNGMFWLIAGFAPLLASLAHYYPKAGIWQIALAIVLVYWITAGICIIIGYLGRIGETLLLGAWLVLLGLLLLGGCIYPYQLLPDWLQVMTSLSPARWSSMMIYDSLAMQPMNTLAPVALGAMMLIVVFGSYLAWRHARPGV